MPSSNLPAVPKNARLFKLKQFPPVGGGIDIKRDFELVTEPLWKDGENKDGKIVVKVLYHSNDPAQRTWFVDKDEHYITPVKPGMKVSGFGIGLVLESHHPKFQPGDLAEGMFGWAEHTVIPVDAPRFAVNKVAPEIDPAQYMALGMTALTAYFGFLYTAAATSKDSLVVVSGAAGATGSVVTQIAKRVLGIKNVWGIAGGAQKCKLVEEQCACDRSFDYKDPNWEKEFVKEAEKLGGVDVYFDNTGGPILDCILRNSTMKTGGRVACCGAISGYDNDEAAKLSAESWRTIVFKTLRVQGFLVFQFEKDYPKAIADLQAWTKEGKVKPLSTIFEAKFEDVPEGMMKLLRGENTGKLVTKIVA